MSKVKIIPELRFPEFKNDGEWTFEELEQCLDYLQPTPYLVESTDYKDEYEIPVLTAGKTYILGYTNEKEVVFRENLPVIIFDDFTTASQFVDFPFKAKSSAMKILLAKNDNNIKFVYEAIKNFNYEVGVHQRHWISIFSKLRIAIPKNPKEQQKIASCLSSLDEIIATYGQKLNLLKDHKKGMMQNLFPQEGEKVPKYRFKEFEKDGEWELKPFSKYIKLYRGSSPRPIIEYQTQGVDGVNWIKIGDTGSVTDFVIRSVSEKITPKGAEKSRAVKRGELILANSMSYGSTYLLEIEGCIYDGWFVLREYDEVFDKQFLLQLLNSEFMQNQYKKLAAGGIVQNISSEIVYSTLLPKTSKTEQQKIASCLSSLDALITAQGEKIEQLKLHKKGLMQGLFPKIEI
jgi:type I restriction enzyme S subunit